MAQQHQGDSSVIDTLIHGDALDVLKTLESNSIDSCVVDPPYGLGEVKDIAGLLQAWIHDEDDKPHLGKSGFMNATWDAGVPGPRYWREVLRVMKPGAHILCFASTRTVDLMMIALRLAGFQCRDTLMWVTGQGFPKNTDISKKIDKMRGAKRKVIGVQSNHRNRPQTENWDKSNHIHEGNPFANRNGHLQEITAPATPEARQHAGTGTALKPAHEPIILARKPLSEKTIAENVLKWNGCGALNIDASRVGTQDNLDGGAYSGDKRRRTEYTSTDHDGSMPLSRLNRGIGEYQQPQGRFPSNLLLSHSVFCVPLGMRKVKGNAPQGRPSLGSPMPNGFLTGGKMIAGCYADPDGMEEVEAYDCHPSCPILQLDIQSGIRGNSYRPNGQHGAGHAMKSMFFDSSNVNPGNVGYHDQGGASRYFAQFQPTPEDYAPFLYCSKASRAERNRGCEGLPYHSPGECTDRKDGSLGLNNPRAGAGRTGGNNNHHPTVKSLSLMRYLVRLCTPPGGTVLDCFAGSGSTLVACVQSSFNFIGIEQSEEYCSIAEARIAYARKVVV